MDDKIGSIEIGKKADLIIIEENPLENLKVLYGTGAIKLNDKNEVKRVGGIKYTIKDGIVYVKSRLFYYTSSEGSLRQVRSGNERELFRDLHDSPFKKYFFNKLKF